MAAEFNRLGFRFLYPENWVLEVEETTGWPRSVTVSSPEGAMWSATADRLDAAELCEKVVAAISSEYDDVERNPVQRTVGDQLLDGIELHFWCLDLLVVAQVLICPSALTPSVIWLQAESRDFSELEQVFDAISWSYLQHRERTG